MTSQDLIKGIDFTGLTSVSASEMNQSVDSAQPASDKGLQIETQDSALDTPVVPDPNTLLEGIIPTQWKRYTWKRVSFIANGAVKHYAWNPQLSTPDATFLNWQWIEADAEAALTAANNAAILATTANTNATTALTAATTAQAAATAAQTTANTANTNAATAVSTANTAATNIAAVQVTVTALTSSVTVISNSLTNVINRTFRVALGSFYMREQQTQGTDAGTFTSGAWTKRVLNHIEGDNENLVTALICVLNGDNTFTLQPGKYTIEAEAPALNVRQHQCRLVDDDDNGVILTGSSEYCSEDSQATTRSKVAGYFEVPIITKFRIEHICAMTYATSGLGLAGNFTDEIYTQVKISYIGNL